MDNLQNKQRSLRKIVYSYLFILFIFWIIIGTSYFIFSSTNPYSIAWGDIGCQPGECSFGTNLFVFYFFIPLVTFLSFFGILLIAPYGLTLFEFSFITPFQVISFLYFWSMPLIFGIYFKKRGKNKIGNILIGLFILIPLYLLIRTILFILPIS